MLRCFIVDDEAPARQRLKRLLSAENDIDIIGEAADGLSALEQISAVNPDLIFLDIDMPELDGLAVAAALTPRKSAIIFATAYDEHAVRAFELSAVDYLVKPIGQDRLHAAIEKVRSSCGATPPDLTALLAKLDPTRVARRMAVRCGNKYIVFDVAKVSAIVARDHYCAILVEDKELLSEDTLNDLAARLDPIQFMRIHRSAVINLLFLKELRHQGDRQYIAVLSDIHNTHIPVSRDRLPQLKAALGLP